jgi:hypothetical protein
VADLTEPVNRALRTTILTVAGNRGISRAVGRYGMRLGAGRFVAGETLDEAVPVLRRLNEQGLEANTTILGEAVHDEAATRPVVEAYHVVIDRLRAEELRCNVALKLTHLGVELDEELAFANVRELVEHAASAGNFVRIDMEDSSVTDATLRIYRRLREGGLDAVGTVLQSYLFRTEEDLRSLLPLKPNLRIVKGAYAEVLGDTAGSVGVIVAGFLVAVAVRSTGVLPPSVLGVAQGVETALLTAAMIGLGTSVRLGTLIRTAGRSALVGLLAWILIAGVALVGVHLAG